MYKSGLKYFILIICREWSRGKTQDLGLRGSGFESCSDSRFFSEQKIRPTFAHQHFINYILLYLCRQRISSSSSQVTALSYMLISPMMLSAKMTRCTMMRMKMRANVSGTDSVGPAGTRKPTSTVQLRTQPNMDQN